MEMQKCNIITFSDCKIFCAAVKDTNGLTSYCKEPDTFFFPILTEFGVCRLTFVEVPNVKFQGNPFSRSRAHRETGQKLIGCFGRLTQEPPRTGH